MSGPAPRWTPCPRCGSPSYVLFVRVYCTAEGCMWRDQRAYEEWLEDRAEGAPVWVWAVGPEG